MYKVACIYRVATELDIGRLVEVIDLLHYSTAGLLARISIVVVVVVVVVVVFVFVANFRVVDHNQQRDKQWTYHTRQYLTAQTTLYWCIAPLRAVICIIIITMILTLFKPS